MYQCKHFILLPDRTLSLTCYFQGRNTKASVNFNYSLGHHGFWDRYLSWERCPFPGGLVKHAVPAVAFSFLKHPFAFGPLTEQCVFSQKNTLSMKIHQDITGVSAGEMAYQVKALATKAHNLSSISGLPWKVERIGSHRLASDFLPWHTIIHLPSSLQNPQVRK